MPGYRFGTFEFESSSGELKRDGLPVRVQAQPGQVLAILLENAAQIVTRETLQQRVWSDGTQVDFERGLNYCIAQVRAALGDSAESPRFVKTVPKKGYQFIAPVEVMRAPAPPARPKRTGIVWAAAAAALIAVTVWAFSKAEPKRPIVAVCLFANETGDPQFDRIASGFADSLTAELASSGLKQVQVIGNADILHQPRAQQNLAQIQAQLGANYVVVGQIQKDPNEVRVLAHLLRMPKQTHVTIERLDASPMLDNPLQAEADFARKASTRFLKALAAR